MWRCWSGQADQVQRAGEGRVGDLAQAGGDAAVPGGAQGADREAVQGGHVLRAMAGADLRGVLAECGRALTVWWGGGVGQGGALVGQVKVSISNTMNIVSATRNVSDDGYKNGSSNPIMKAGSNAALQI